MTIDRTLSDSILFGFVGDLHVDRPRPTEAFQSVLSMLRAPDVLYGNLGGPCSDAPISPPGALPVISNSETLNVYPSSGFKILGMANNHILDAGHKAMLDNLSRLNHAGVLTCGAGADLNEARRPAIVTLRGRTIGILAYGSVFPHGYEAQSDRPGIAPLRAYNCYHDIDPDYYLPGSLPRVETQPDPIDHQNLIDDIGATRSRVNTLVVTIHWGDHRRPHALSDHELRVARLCIDHGADVVIGHHHHALRGIEWYKKKPIFYGLGHFVLDCPWTSSATDERKAMWDAAARRDPNSYELFPREGWPLLPLHPDTRMTMMGWVMIQADRIVDAGFVPCRLAPEGHVLAVDPRSQRGEEIVKYVTEGNRRNALNGKPDINGAPLIGGCAAVRIVPLDA